MKPSCTEIVSHALWESLRFHSLRIEGTAAVPENQTEEARSTERDTSSSERFAVSRVRVPSAGCRVLWLGSMIASGMQNE